MDVVTTPMTVAPLAKVNLATKASQPTVQRVIVLIPQQEMDDSGLARRIWSLAAPRSLKVLYLGLCVDVSREYRLRRRLVTLAAITRDDRVFVETQLEIGNDWLRTVKTVWRPGDMVVCHAEQIAGMRRRPLSEAMISTLQVPVCILNGFYSPDRVNPALLKGVVSWFGSIAIIVGFFWVQAGIERMAKDWAHTALLYLSVVAEFGLIWIWNHLFF